MAIDIRITPELEREGLSRDIVRHIQQIRKELDLDLMDHINVAYETADEVLLQAIEENRQHIRGETLCNELFPGHSESAKEITLSGPSTTAQAFGSEAQARRGRPEPGRTGGRDIRLMVQKVG